MNRPIVTIVIVAAWHLMAVREVRLVEHGHEGDFAVVTRPQRLAMRTGTIARLLIDKGFGFIRDEDGSELFFHRSAVRGAAFELLREGQHVEFTLDESGKGPRAGEVSLKDARSNPTQRWILKEEEPLATLALISRPNWDETFATLRRLFGSGGQDGDRRNAMGGETCPQQ